MCGISIAGARIAHSVNAPRAQLQKQRAIRRAGRSWQIPFLADCIMSIISQHNASDGIFAPFTCPYCLFDPDVVVMQAAQDRDRDDVTDGLNRPADRCVLAQREMCANAIIIGGVSGQDSAQMAPTPTPRHAGACRDEAGG